LRGLFSPGDIARTLDIGEGEVREVLFDGQEAQKRGSYNAEQASWFEANLYMQNQLLRDTDVMSMNHGLEVRVPFLDEDFTNLAQCISPDIRFTRQQPKKVLIDSFNGLLPQAVWNRPKMGFSFPLQSWMSQYKPIADSNLYKGELAKKTIKKFTDNQIHWSKAFALYQIQPYV
jgi:asparagine synthase (glutamine-hydrolysing)